MTTSRTRFDSLGTIVTARLIPIVAILLSGCGSSAWHDDPGTYPLWKVEGKGNTIWILGSVHMLPERAHPFPAAFDQAYEDADRLIFEVDLSATDPTALFGLMQSLMLPAGQTLEDVLSEETWEMLEPRLDDLVEGMMTMMSAAGGDAGGEEMPGLPMGELDPDMIKEFMKPALLRMKPWFIAFILQSQGAARDDYKAELGVDLFYMNRAKEDEKKISGLETFEQQLGFLEKTASGNEDEFLRAVLEQKSSEDDMLDKLVDAWMKGDLMKLDELMNASLKESPEIREILLLQRNRNWVPQIEDLLNDEENYLIVVGAGHLIGEGSVIDLLRKKGYKVTRR